MHRKIILLLAAFFLTVPVFSANPRPRALSPYQYGGHWYVSLQAGPLITLSENAYAYWKYGQGWKLFPPHAGFSLGYDIDDAWGVRLSGSYSYNAGACDSYEGFYPYRYQVAQAFVDAVLNCNGLGENFTPVSFKTYLGPGMAYTHHFSSVDHPYQVVEGPNLVPGFRVGGIVEFDGPGGFGWFLDMGFALFSDWYNGLEPSGIVIDMESKFSIGIIYHFPSGD